MSRPATAPTNPEVAAGLSNLAMVLRDLGNPGEARPLAERALAIAEATYSPDHTIVAARLNNLSMVLQTLGDAAGERILAERAAASRQPRE